MPKSIFYRANTIIYFQGDKAEHVLVLKNGKVKLTEKNELTDSENTVNVELGEFFGMKAAVAGAYQSETAMAVQDSTVVHMTLPEFESIITDNHRILMKILRMLSSSLRQIHKKIKSLLAQELQNINPETGLFSIGEYFFNEGRYALASEAFNRYLKYWPMGIYAPQAMARIGDAGLEMEKILDHSKDNEDIHTIELEVNNLDDADKAYAQNNFDAAFKGYLNLSKSQSDPDNNSYIEFRIGCCLYHLSKYTDSVKQLTSLLKQHPRHKYSNENIWYLGLGYEALGKKEKAIQFYIKVSKMEPEGSTLHDRIVKKMKKLELDNES